MSERRQIPPEQQMTRRQARLTGAATGVAALLLTVIAAAVGFVGWEVTALGSLIGIYCTIAVPRQLEKNGYVVE